MNEDLLILLEPRVHIIPEKGEVALQCGSILSRFEVSAGCVVEVMRSLTTKCQRMVSAAWCDASRYSIRTSAIGNQ